MKTKGKKTTILYVLKLLQEASSVEKPITQSLIAKTIHAAGIDCDRRTVANDIDTLIHFGYKIIKNKGGGCYLIDNRVIFDAQEYRVVTRCIDVSNIDENIKIKLKSKIKLLINVIEI